MSQEKNNSEIDVEKAESTDNGENKSANSEQSENVGEVRLEVKKKRFVKSDILVFCACLVVSVLVWMYASNLQKKDDESKLTKDDMLSKDDIIEVVESNMNKVSESATEVAE